MSEYRYHRMTNNENNWHAPHSERLSKSSDYVGENGFGHEDWNFSKDIWADGKYHLYLRQSPARVDKNSKFNIVLGVRTGFGHLVVGFAENVSYSTSVLDDTVWRRRANELKQLDDDSGLAGDFRGLSSNEILTKLKSTEPYEVAVEPNNLLILDQPIVIPADIYEIKSNRYQLIRMNSDEYGGIKAYVLGETSQTTDFVTEFPEGALVERLHTYRERNRKLVQLAKDGFIRKHGLLYCEVCSWEPQRELGISELKNRIIEAHHDVPIGSKKYSGKTMLRDLRMLCPNCHRAIHFIRPWMTVDEFRNSTAVET